MSANVDSAYTLRKRYGLLALAVALTLLVRLVYGLLVFDHIADRYFWRRDDGHSDLGYTIATSGKYAFSETSSPTMKRLPVTPSLFAGIYVIVGRSLAAVQVFQSLLCALTCILVYLTAREVSDEKVATIAALVFAVYPNSILYSARTISETTYSFLLSVFCLMLVRQFKRFSARTAIATGLAFGLLILTKSTLVLLPFFLFLTLLFDHYRKRLRHVVGGIVVIVLVAVLALSPWIVRNYGLTGKVIPLSTWGGAPFYHGYYLATHLGDGRSPGELDRAASEERVRLVRERYTPSGQPVDEYHQDRITYSLVWERIMADPLYSSWLFLRNAFLAWFLTFNTVTTIVSFFVHMPLLLLSAYAILLMLRRDPDTWIKMLPLVLVYAYCNLFQAVVFPHVRYMAPVIGVVVTILVAYSISHLVLRVRSSWTPGRVELIGPQEPRRQGS